MHRKICFPTLLQLMDSGVFHILCYREVRIQLFEKVIKERQLPGKRQELKAVADCKISKSLTAKDTR